MDNGWSKILVKEVMTQRDFQDVDRISNTVTRQFWFFANCTEGLVGQGMRSDRVDADITSIYTVDGFKKNVTASGNLYERWKVLCEATSN